MDRITGWVLVIYLLGVGLVATANLVTSFDAPPAPVATGMRSCVYTLVVCDVQGDHARLLRQAFLAGIVGSYLHAAQSLTSYLGNGEFKLSWTAWYVMRPWIGGILALALALAVRAGFVGGAGSDAPNPFGIVGLGLLGGWFSKTTTDKLQETFSTLFKTDADKERKDKLQVGRPSVAGVEPSTVAIADTALTIRGHGFVSGTVVILGGVRVEPVFVSATELRVDLTRVARRPSGEVTVTVANPADRTAGESVTVTFEPSAAKE